MAAKIIIMTLLPIKILSIILEHFGDFLPRDGYLLFSGVAFLKDNHAFF
jgi:hypothetical protein